MRAPAEPGRDAAESGRRATLISLAQASPVGVAILAILAMNAAVLLGGAPLPGELAARKARNAQAVDLSSADLDADSRRASPAQPPGTETDNGAVPPPPENPTAEGRIDLVEAPPQLEAFHGLSTWVDLHDTQLTPEEQAQRAAAGGVDTIFVQTARFNSPAPIHDPNRLGRLIEEAHDLGLEVMTWYIADFVHPQRDLHRAKAAVAFETPRGDRADAFGLDIEIEAVRNTAERTRRLLWISHKLREAVGSDYPLAAIVLPPLQLDLRPSWWPGFPYDKLTRYYDVFIPMSYSSYRGRGPHRTFQWNLANVIELRDRAGDADLPVHLAGGIADELPHVDQFVRALEHAKVLGGGLYDLHTTPRHAWGPLQAVRAR